MLQSSPRLRHWLTQSLRLATHLAPFFAVALFGAFQIEFHQAHSAYTRYTSWLVLMMAFYALLERVQRGILNRRTSRRTLLQDIWLVATSIALVGIVMLCVDKFLARSTPSSFIVLFVVMALAANIQRLKLSASPLTLGISALLYYSAVAQLSFLIPSETWTIQSTLISLACGAVSAAVALSYHLEQTPAALTTTVRKFFLICLFLPSMIFVFLVQLLPIPLLYLLPTICIIPTALLDVKLRRSMPQQQLPDHFGLASAGIGALFFGTLLFVRLISN